MQWTKRIVAAIAELWIQKRCLVTGHNGIREGGQGEIFDRCDRCGRRSPGWQLPANGPVRLAEPTAAARARARNAARAAGWAVESVFGIPTGDPSPFLDDAGFEPVPASLAPFHRVERIARTELGRVYARREVDFVVAPTDDTWLLAMPTKGVH